MSALLRLGSIVIVKDLAASALGKVSRGVTLVGDHASQHVLVRFYDEPLSGPHVDSHREALSRRIGRLPGSRGLGSGHALLPSPHLGYTMDFVPGRTLAQVLARAEEEELRLEPEQALTLAAGMCLALTQAHARGLDRGMLGPDSVWVGFDGSVTLLDACLGVELEAAVSDSTLTGETRGPGTWPPGRRDDRVLGCMLMEMLTSNPMLSSSPEGIVSAARALERSAESLRGSQTLSEIVARLLGENPYPGLEQAHRDFEELLAQGEFGPTTFTLAFFMHQVFRQETFRDRLEEKDELGMVFEKRALSAPEGMVEPLHRSEGRRRKTFLIGAALSLLALTGGGIAFQRAGRTHQAGQDPVLQAERMRHEQRLSELTQAELDLTKRIAALSAQAENAMNAEIKARMERELLQKRKEKDDLESRAHLMRAASTSSVKVQPVSPIEAAAPAPSQAEPPAAPAPVPGRESASAPASVNERQNVDVRVLTRSSVSPAVWAEAWKTVSVIRTVRVRVYVDKNGRGLKTLVEHQGLSPALEEQFKRAALQCSFAPARRLGEPVPGWVVVDFHST